METLFNGDCREIIKTLTPSKTIIVTDPPFNIGYKYSTYKDKMPKSEYLNMLVELVKNFPTVLVHYPETLYEVAIGGGMLR